MADDRPGAPHARLLVVEDDARLARGLCRNLELEGFDTEHVASGEAALQRLDTEGPVFDLVILDVMLPGIGGFEVCQRLRQQGNTLPILFLTALGSDADRILGLRLGADDYLTKPFVFEELVLRVGGILRRAAWSRTPSSVSSTLHIGDSTVSLQEMRAQALGETLNLTEREVMLLRYLAENEGNVVSRGELLERVWGYTFDTATRTLDTFIHRLRKYFEADPRHPRHFHTVHGVGYRFTSDPS